MERAWLGALVALIVAGGCASAGPGPEAAAWRSRLRAVMEEDVATRETRDAHSRVLVEAVEAGALKGLNLAGVQAAFGQGRDCSRYALCAEQGFSDSDLYFPIGRVIDEKSVKQLPVLIVGFDPHQRVQRVWTLRTH